MKDTVLIAVCLVAMLLVGCMLGMLGSKVREQDRYIQFATAWQKRVEASEAEVQVAQRNFQSYLVQYEKLTKELKEVRAAAERGKALLAKEMRQQKLAMATAQLLAKQVRELRKQKTTAKKLVATKATKNPVRRM